MFSGSQPHAFRQIQNVFLYLFFLSNFCFLATPPLSPSLWSVWFKVVLWTPTSAVDLYNSISVIVSVFVEFLMKRHLAWYVSFGGWCSLVRFGVVLYSSHSVVMNSMCSQEYSKSGIFFYNPALIYTS